MSDSTFKRVDWRKLQTDDPFEQMLIDSARAGTVMLGYNEDGDLAAKLTEHGKEYVETEILAVDSGKVMKAFAKRFPDRAQSADDIAAVESRAADISEQANKFPVKLRFTVVHSLLDALMA